MSLGAWFYKKVGAFQSHDRQLSQFVISDLTNADCSALRRRLSLNDGDEILDGAMNVVDAVRPRAQVLRLLRHP